MVRFSEIAYQRPDMDALKDAAEKATRKVCAAKNYAEAREAYFSLQEMGKAGLGAASGSSRMGNGKRIPCAALLECCPVLFA